MRGGASLVLPYKWSEDLSNVSVDPVTSALTPKEPQGLPLTPWDPLGVSLDLQTKPDYQETSWLLRRLLQSLPLVLFDAYHTVHFISRTFLGQFGLVSFLIPTLGMPHDDTNLAVFNIVQTRGRGGIKPMFKECPISTKAFWHKIGKFDINLT